MPSDLSPEEKESRQVTRLINKTPAPSRKKTTRRAPKRDNRRVRMKVSDPDMETKDPDMSLNYKVVGTSQFAAPESQSEKLEVKANSAIKHYYQVLHDASPKLADSFKEFVQDEIYGQEPEKILKWVDNEFRTLKKASMLRFPKSSGKAVDVVVSAWKNGEKHVWAYRAGVITAIQDALERIDFPVSFTAPFMKNPKSASNDKTLIMKILADAGNTLSTSDLEKSDFIMFATLASVNRFIIQGPENLDSQKLRKEVEDATQTVIDQGHQIVALSEYMKAWDEAIHEGFINQEGNEDTDDDRADQFFNKIGNDIDKLFNSKKPVFNKKTMAESLADALEKKFGRVPQQILDLAKQTQKE